MKEGYNLKVLGNELIRDYKDLPFVKSAEVILLTDPEMIKGLLPTAEHVTKITFALNKIYENITMDCRNCDSKDVCDEIDEIKLLHSAVNK